jgi:hypothetical protein
MRRVETPRTRRDERLARRMAELEVRPIDLVELGGARRAVRARGELARAVRAWARDSKATRRGVDAPPERLAMAGACALLSPRVVFVAP